MTETADVATCRWCHGVMPLRDFIRCDDVVAGSHFFVCRAVTGRSCFARAVPSDRERFRISAGVPPPVAGRCRQRELR